MKLILIKNDISKIIGRFVIQLNTGENEVQYLTEEENEIIESMTKSRFKELEIIDGIYYPEIININII